jgi:hypothetical protein
MVSMAVWNFGVFGLRSASEPGTALFWERVIHLGVIPMPAFFYHYALAFLEVRLRRPSLVVAYGLAALFLVVSPTPLYIRGVGDTYWGYAPLSGPLYTPFFVYFQAFILWGLVWLIRGYRTTLSSFRRNRILLIVCGVLAGLAGGAVDFIRFIVGWERLYPVGIPANALFALAVGIAIVRYRLIDLGILARRLLLSLWPRPFSSPSTSWSPSSATSGRTPSTSSRCSRDSRCPCRSCPGCRLAWRTSSSPASMGCGTPSSNWLASWARCST